MNAIESKPFFPFLFFMSFVYAMFYGLCFYDNSAGIMQPIFLLGTFLFLYLLKRKLPLISKAKVSFYAIAIMLLSISTVLTSDDTILIFNRLGIFLLLICMVLDQLYDSGKWGFLTHTRNLLQVVVGSLIHIFTPFRDGYLYAKTSEKKQRNPILSVVLGMIIGIPMLLVIGALLLSSDHVMLHMFSEMFNNLDSLPGHILRSTRLIVWIFCVTYGAVVYLLKGKLRTSATKVSPMNPYLIIGITTPITILYFIYSWIQILYLFIGKTDLPDSYTYASYAREGFFQLLLVCTFNLILVLVSLHFFQRSRLVNGILTCISLCTYIMLASSCLRMIMYIRYYYMTYLRILVLWALVVLFFLLTGIVCSIYKKGFPLFRYGMVVVTCCYILLAFSKPDYWIAKINCANLESSTETSDFFLGEPYRDYYYLRKLSLDAAPITFPVVSEYYSDHPYWFDDYTAICDDLGVRNYNVSIAYAKYLREQQSTSSY